ncbi:MAG: hypothetical protein Ta2B_16920 [Termitinemataceae bacterium]|nr:MAG: hypothetical protein Ta2B_16920 [Termitinemataceae bacterium]
MALNAKGFLTFLLRNKETRSVSRNKNVCGKMRGSEGASPTDLAFCSTEPLLRRSRNRVLSAVRTPATLAASTDAGGLHWSL